MEKAHQGVPAEPFIAPPDGVVASLSTLRLVELHSACEKQRLSLCKR